MNKYKLNDKTIDIWGRCNYKDDALFIFWSGSGIETNVQASQLYLKLTSYYEIAEQWLLVIVNDTITQRIMLPKGSSEICIFRSLNKDIVRNIRIVRDSQPAYFDPKAYLKFEELICDGQLLSPPKHKYHLEFIGDSVASGEAIAVSDKEVDYLPGNATANNFVMRSAKMLDGKYSCLSVGGWGVASSWDGNLNQTMPKVYEKICGVVDVEGCKDNYDFNEEMDYIIIHLGTNDTNSILRNKYSFYDEGDKVERMRDITLRISEDEGLQLSEAVYDFLKLIRKYNSKAKIIWTYGVLLVQAEDIITKGINKYIKDYNDNKVYYYTTINSLDDLGAFNHPSNHFHDLMAKQLYEKILEIENNI